MALKIKTRDEAIAVVRDMVRRKKEMEAKAQIDFAKSLSKSGFLLYSIPIRHSFYKREGCAQICSNIWRNASGARY